MRGPDRLRVSAIVPSYNAAAFLGEALDSILEQDYPLHEIIVVDDGSTDETATVLARYGSLIRSMTQPNRGIGAARNAGLALATGDCIAFLDADDVWPAGSLRLRAEALAADPALGMVFGAMEHFLTPGLEDTSSLYCPPGTRQARFAGTCLIRADMFQRIGGFRVDLACAETIDWLARAQEAGMASRAIDALVMRRRIHGANTVTTLADRRGDYLRALKASLDRRRAAH